MITWVDWGIWLVYFAVIFTVLWFYRQSKNDDIYQWFLKGFIVKVFGGIVFTLVSLNYYGGDTLLYFRGASVLSNVLVDDPYLYFKLLFMENNLPSEFQHIATQISYSRTAEEWYMVKFLSILSFLSFNSYLVLTLMLNVISFWGGWKLFKFFSDIIPKNKGHIFIIVFLFPSVFFWGNGILKDTVTLALINYIIYRMYFTIQNKSVSTYHLLTMIISAYVIYKLKSYIILAFIPSAVFIIYQYSKSKIKSTIVRFIAGPILVVFFALLGFLSLKSLSQSTNYSAENIQNHIKGFHTWHTTTGGSSYNLGDIKYTPVGIASKIPAALNATFFRPYIWTARNPIMLIGALESTFVLLFFSFVLIKTRFRVFKYLSQNYYLQGLLIFVLLFGFAIGFTSYNFGALARYKMPIYSLFIFILYYVNEQKNKASF